MYNNSFSRNHDRSDIIWKEVEKNAINKVGERERSKIRQYVRLWSTYDFEWYIDYFQLPV